MTFRISSNALIRKRGVAILHKQRALKVYTVYHFSPKSLLSYLIEIRIHNQSDKNTNLTLSEILFVFVFHKPCFSSTQNSSRTPQRNKEKVPYLFPGGLYTGNASFEGLIVPPHSPKRVAFNATPYWPTAKLEAAERRKNDLYPVLMRFRVTRPLSLQLDLIHMRRTKSRTATMRARRRSSLSRRGDPARFADTHTDNGGSERDKLTSRFRGSGSRDVFAVMNQARRLSGSVDSNHH